jgi:hypothetical protein
MDKVLDEASLLKRIDELVVGISQATVDLTHSGKEVQLLTF